MALDVKIDSARLLRVLKAAPQELDRAMVGVANRIGFRYLGFHRARRMRGPPGVRATNRGLPRQFRVDVTGTKLDRLRVSIGTRSGVALLHERGGTTRSKAGALAVPFSSLSKAEQKTAKRLLRQTRDVIRARNRGEVLRKKGRRVKSLDVFVIESRKKGKNRFLVQKRGTRGGLKFLFHLEKKVVNKPILGFFALWKEFRPTAIKLFNQGIRFALAATRRKAGSGGQREAA
jgi:hypothetical protein